MWSSSTTPRVILTDAGDDDGDRGFIPFLRVSLRVNVWSAWSETFHDPNCRSGLKAEVECPCGQFSRCGLSSSDEVDALKSFLLCGETIEQAARVIMPLSSLLR